METAFPALLDRIERQTGRSFRRRPKGDWQGACPLCEPGGKGHHLYLKARRDGGLMLYCQHG